MSASVPVKVPSAREKALLAKKNQKVGAAAVAAGATAAASAPGRPFTDYNQLIDTQPNSWRRIKLGDPYNVKDPAHTVYVVFEKYTTSMKASGHGKSWLLCWVAGHQPQGQVLEKGHYPVRCLFPAATASLIMIGLMGDHIKCNPGINVKLVSTAFDKVHNKAKLDGYPYHLDQVDKTDPAPVKRDKAFMECLALSKQLDIFIAASILSDPDVDSRAKTMATQLFAGKGDFKGMVDFMVSEAVPMANDQKAPTEEKKLKGRAKTAKGRLAHAETFWLARSGDIKTPAVGEEKKKRMKQISELPSDPLLAEAIETNSEYMPWPVPIEKFALSGTRFGIKNETVSYDQNPFKTYSSYDPVSKKYIEPTTVMKDRSGNTVFTAEVMMAGYVDSDRASFGPRLRLDRILILGFAWNKRPVYGRKPVINVDNVDSKLAASLAADIASYQKEMADRDESSIVVIADPDAEDEDGGVGEEEDSKSSAASAAAPAPVAFASVAAYEQKHQPVPATAAAAVSPQKQPQSSGPIVAHRASAAALAAVPDSVTAATAPAPVPKHKRKAADISAAVAAPAVPAAAAAASASDGAVAAAPRVKKAKKVSVPAPVVAAAVAPVMESDDSDL